MNLLPLEFMLKDPHKIHSKTAEDGVEEVSLFKENMEKECCPIRYKLVLTDLNMPNMDGFDAAIKILDYQK